MNLRISDRQLQSNGKQFQSNHTCFIDVASLTFTTHTVPYASTLTPAACTLKLNLENKESEGHRRIKLGLGHLPRLKDGVRSKVLCDVEEVLLCC